jgi:vacuolar iron transporter family protein
MGRGHEANLEDDKSLRRYLTNLQGEIDSIALYRGLAQLESKPEVSSVYRRLAELEQDHAEFWKTRLAAIGHPIPELQTRWRTRALIWLARRFGPAFVLPIATSLERGGSGEYDTQPEAAAGGLPAAERSHARMIEALAAPAPALSIAALTRLEGRHQTGTATALRAAVLGANDGLVSNLSLVMGVAGAAMRPHAILVTGLAGLVAGGCAMAMGEWLSVSTSNESYLNEIEVRAEEISQMTIDEREQLARIYRAKGLGEEAASAMAERLISQHSRITPESKEATRVESSQLRRSAWIAAVSSFLLFAIGALFPVLPFFVLSGAEAIVASLVLCALVLLLVGAGTTLFTGRNPLSAGLRQLVIGLAAAGVTFAIGRLVGVAIGD